MNLRPYQQTALDEIRRHYAAGTKRVLLHLATGGG
jgi:superfamily II DNA or RNA helicase